MSISHGKFTQQPRQGIKLTRADRKDKGKRQQRWMMDLTPLSKISPRIEIFFIGKEKVIWSPTKL